GDRKAPIDGPATVAQHDVPQPEIEGQVQDGEGDEDLDEPAVEGHRQDHHQYDEPEPQLGVEILLPVELLTTAQVTLLHTALGVQTPVASGFPSLAATLAGDEAGFG